MRWTESELSLLLPILDRIQDDLEPLDGKNLLVLCSADGQVAFRLAGGMTPGRVTGVELDPGRLVASRQAAAERGLDELVKFLPAEKTRLPFPDGSFDGLVSEFIVFPTPMPTEIGQPEMARVLKAGGKIILTDVIVTRTLPPGMREDLKAVGLDYLCEAAPDDFRKWMASAGLADVELVDFTALVRLAWERKKASDEVPNHLKGYQALLDDPQFGLGKAIFYIYVFGRKKLDHS